MNTQTYTLEFITPCFCAGADQARAEIRASAIRGQLRWWFRALGGDFKLENEIFGGIAGGEGNASSVVVRVQEVRRGVAWRPPKIDPNADEAYVWYYASVSGKQPGKSGAGPRWTEQGNLPPGTKIQLDLFWRRNLSDEARQRFDEALSVFLALGAVGMRVTRGLGAFACGEQQLTEQKMRQIKEIFAKRRFGLDLYKEGMNLWTDAIREAGTILKHKLRAKFSAGKNGDKTSPLGSSKPRQTSALFLRPARRMDNKFSLYLFEAPAVLKEGTR